MRDTEGGFRPFIFSTIILFIGQVMERKHYEAILLLALCVTSGCNGGCTYADIALSMSDCFDVSGLPANYVFPKMTSMNAVLFCTSFLSTMNSCVQGVLLACSSNSNVTQFFENGTALTDGYSYICSEYINNGNVEPFSCAGNVPDGNIDGYQTAFDSSVDSLSDPSLTDICSFAETLTTSFEEELEGVCSSSELSISIWKTYFATFRSACSSASYVTASLVLVSAALMMSLVNMENVFYHI